MKSVIDTAFHEDTAKLTKYEFELIARIYDLSFDLVRKPKEVIADDEFYKADFAVFIKQHRAAHEDKAARRRADGLKELERWQS